MALLQPVLAALATSAIFMLAVFFLDRNEQRRHRRETRAEALDRIGAMRARIEGYLHSKTFIARGLAAYVSQNPDLTLDQFNRYAAEAMNGEQGIRYLALIKGSRIQYIHPLAGVEDMLGFDILSNESQREATYKIMETGRQIVAGPLEIRPGQIAFINEAPIFVSPTEDDPPPAEGRDAKGKFWGIAALTLDFNYLVKRAGILDSSSNLRIGIRGKDGLGEQGELFYGDPQIFNPGADPVRVEVAIPNGTWVIAAAPAGGWVKLAPGSWGWRLGGGLLAAIAGLFVGLLVWTPQRLGELVEIATTALREAEEKYRGIFEHAQEGIFQASPDGEIFSANPALARILGYDSPESLIESGVKIGRDLIADSARGADFQRLMESRGAVTAFEARMRRRDGVAIWMRINARAVVDPSGVVTHYEGTIVDITERRHAMEALRLSQEELRKKADSLAAVIRISDSLYRTLDFKTVVQRALDDIAEYTRSPGVAIFDLAEDAEHVRLLSYRGLDNVFKKATGVAPIKASLTGLAMSSREVFTSEDVGSDPRVNHEIRGLLRREGLIGLVCVPLLYQDQALGAINLFFNEAPALGPQERETLISIGKTIALAMDNASHVSQIEAEVRERRRAEEALVESEARYRLVSELTSDFAYSAELLPNGRMRLEWITEAYWKITGYSASEMNSATKWKGVVHPDDWPKMEERNQRLLRFESVAIEFRIITKTGDIRWLGDIAQPVRSPNQEEIRIYGAGQDITERKRSEEERAALESRLRHSQKMEAIGTLAGGVAHDFNNLLTGILGYSNLLKMEATPGSATFKAAEVIEKAAERASHLTKQLLGFARRGKLQNVAVDLHATMSEVAGLLSRTVDKSITISQRFGTAELYVRGDPDQLQQVFLNLAVNARDAMPKGGELIFSSELYTLSSEEAWRYNDAAPGEYVIITVTDTGEGIPEEIRERIFEPFFTTKEHGKGTGMGLAMVYGIIKNHGGFLRVDSRVGKGTSMRVFLPMETGLADSRAQVKSSEPIRGRGRILVVDDESVVRELARDMLVSLGYEVITAGGSEEAAEIYARSWRELDLILVDMIMPRMGAKELFAKLREINPDVKCVLSTGYGRDGAAQEILDSGMVGFVQKPYRLIQLSEVIAQGLGVGAGPRESDNPATT